MMLFIIMFSSYNNDVIITISWHIENHDIVRIVYSGIFKDIQQYSDMLRCIKGIKANSGIIEAYGGAIIRHIRNSA